VDEKDLNIIKSIMTHIHIILGRQNEKNFTFGSVQELYDKVLLSMEPLEDNNSSYYSIELLESFNTSIEWMKNRDIIIYENDKEMGKSPAVRIDKEKLIKYIINPENMEVHSQKKN
jgi:hypothetical protein